MEQLLGIAAAVGGLSTVAFAVYALVLSRSLRKADSRADVAVGKERIAEAKLLTALTDISNVETKLDNANDEIERLKDALKDARGRKQETYAANARDGAAGAGDAVDDTLRRVYPDADPDAVRAGRDAGGPVPGDAGGPAAIPGEDDLFARDRR